MEITVYLKIVLCGVKWPGDFQADNPGGVTECEGAAPQDVCLLDLSALLYMRLSEPRQNLPPPCGLPVSSVRWPYVFFFRCHAPQRFSL